MTTRVAGQVLAPTAGVLDEDPAVRYVFSTRTDGNMSLVVGETGPHGAGSVQARRRAVSGLGHGHRHAARDLDLDDVIFAEQVHGARVAIVEAADRGRGTRRHEDTVPGVDGLVTFDVNVVLGVLVADCVPVLLADPGRGVAAVHAGRRGVFTGIVPEAVRTLARTLPSDLVAVIGPAIGGCCYAVPPEMVEEMAGTTPEGVARTRRGEPALDLPGAVEAQLRHAGVDAITRVGACVSCHKDRWFSHRASSDGPDAGRQVALICRRSGYRPSETLSTFDETETPR